VTAGWIDVSIHIPIEISVATAEFYREINCPRTDPCEMLTINDLYIGYDKTVLLTGITEGQLP
jgi:hypothetical protein